MQYYLDICILSDPEFKVTTLMSALYNKLHRALAQFKKNTIGLSFPEMDQDRPTLGTIMRLHGNEVDLRQLMAKNWLVGMRDHTSVGNIMTIPVATQYRLVSRIQVKSNVERLRRRLIKRKGISEEHAQEAISDDKAKISLLPYVIIKSQSTGQTFKLFLEHKTIQSNPINGEFSAYGLSHTGTIPWF